MAKTPWKNMPCAFENCGLRGAGASRGRREGQQDTEKLCIRTAVPQVTDEVMSGKPRRGEALAFPALSQAAGTGHLHSPDLKRLLISLLKEHGSGSETPR